MYACGHSYVFQCFNCATLSHILYRVMVQTTIMLMNTTKESGTGAKGRGGAECTIVMDQFMRGSGLKTRGTEKDFLG